VKEHKVIGMRKSFFEPVEAVSLWEVVKLIIGFLVLLQGSAIIGYWIVRGELWLIELF